MMVRRTQEVIGYLDLPSGISGDMFLGCLVDCGWPMDELRATIDRLKLPANSWSIGHEPVMRGSLRASLVTVDVVEGEHHRNLHDIGEIIGEASLPDQVKVRALNVFTRLAQAEAHVHGTTPEEVHFHEVGALDAIIDIVGVCAGLDALGVTKLYASAMPLGDGWANTAHGKIPLPAPATLALLAEVQAPTRPAPGSGELVTPTGATLLAEFAEFRQPALSLQRIGLGAGRKEFAWPNIARLWLGEADGDDDQGHNAGVMVQIETNIDDMNPELYAAVSRQLFANGARDVWMTPIQMKKGRPGVLLSVLALTDQEEELAKVILRETTTLGVRVQQVGRHEADREMRTVQTPQGAVQVKLKRVDGALLGVKPEYDDCVALAEVHNISVRMVYEAAQAAAYDQFVTNQPVTSEA